MSMKNFLKGMIQLMLGGIALLTSSFAMAADVYLMPSLHNIDSATDRPTSCEVGQRDYRGLILRTVMMHDVLRSKQNYYAYATYMGYSSKDPVGKDEIVAKTKPIIEQDIKKMADLVKRGTYFLFVGDLNETIVLGDPGWDTERDHNLRIYMPNIEAYDWSDESVKVFARTGSLPLGSEPSGGTINATLKVSPKDWKEKYDQYLPAGSYPRKNSPVGARLLVDNKLNPVFAEIYVRDTGKTLLSWAAKGQNANKLAALIPETPEAKYDFDNCDSLNPEYYSKKNGSSGKPEEKSDDKKKSKPWWL